MKRATTIALYILCLIALFYSSPASAAPIPCWKVKALLAWTQSEAEAETIARRYGYTSAEIAEAKSKCLK